MNIKNLTKYLFHLHLNYYLRMRIKLHTFRKNKNLSHYELTFVTPSKLLCVFCLPIFGFRDKNVRTRVKTFAILIHSYRILNQGHFSKFFVLFCFSFLKSTENVNCLRVFSTNKWREKKCVWKQIFWVKSFVVLDLGCCEKATNGFYNIWVANGL